MWWQIGTLAAAFFGVAATAGWLEFGRSRRVQRARAEAELLALLPAGDTRDALASKLDADVRAHLKLEENRRFRILLRLAYATVVLQSVAIGAFFVTGIPMVQSGSSGGSLWVVVVALVIAIVTAVLLRSLLAKLRGIVASAGSK